MYLRDMSSLYIVYTYFLGTPAFLQKHRYTCKYTCVYCTYITYKPIQVVDTYMDVLCVSTNM